MGALISFIVAAFQHHIPQLYFASDKPISISVRRALNSKETESISLRYFIETRCPSLFKEFRSAWWLPSGHLQTAYCVVGDFSKEDKVEYDRILLQTVDGGTLGLDFTPPKDERVLPDDTPIVVVLHGLTGSHEAYVRAILAPACTPVQQGGLGYRGIVVNFRGCAGVKLTSPQLYSAAHTDDIRVALMYISRLYPQASLLGLGYSLGANVLTRYLAEEGKHSRLVAGLALACPWNLVANGERLEDTWWRRNIYSKGLAANLQGLLRRHPEYVSEFSGHYIGKAAIKALSLKSPTLRQFDDAMTCISGGASPPFPFPDAYAYYVHGSSHQVLPNIRVPYLAINSEDDPVVQEFPTHTENGWVVLAMTRKGGHLGWFEQGEGLTGLQRWYKRPVLEWLRAVEQDLVSERLPAAPLVEVDGFVKEAGRDDIGYKEIEGGGHVVGVDEEGGLFAGL